MGGFPGIFFILADIENNKSIQQQKMQIVQTTEGYIHTKLITMQDRMVSEFGVKRQTLDHIQQLRQLSGVSLTEWALKLHSQRDETVLQQLYAHCDIPDNKQAAFNKLVCTYLSCFRDATWSLLDTHKK